MILSASLYTMAIFYIVAGANHFFNESFYEKIMPSWLPYHLPLIYLSGVCEMIFGALLIPHYTREFASWMIIAMLIAFLPLHLQMIIDFSRKNNPLLWVAIIRIPLQFVLIGWAYCFIDH